MITQNGLDIGNNMLLVSNILFHSNLCIYQLINVKTKFYRLMFEVLEYPETRNMSLPTSDLFYLIMSQIMGISDIFLTCSLSIKCDTWHFYSVNVKEWAKEVDLNFQSLQMQVEKGDSFHSFASEFHLQRTNITLWTVKNTPLKKALS